MQWKKSNGTLENITALGSGISSISMTFSKGTFSYATASSANGLKTATYTKLASGTVASINSNDTFFKIKVGTDSLGQSTKIEVTFDDKPSAALTAISIEKAPTKTDYYVGDRFDPTGLTIKKTFDDNRTKEFPYAGNEKEFGFIPDLKTELKETNKTVEITVDKKTTSLPITVKPARNVVSVALNGDMSKKAYREGDDWDVSGLYLTVNWNEGEPTTVQLSDLIADTDYFVEPKKPSTGVTSIKIRGYYGEPSFEGTITGLTVAEAPTDLMLAYEAAEKLGLSGSTAQSYKFSGVVVGTIGDSFFVQDKGHGIYVYNKPVAGLTIGKRVNITSTLQTYYGMVETKAVSAATLGGTESIPAAATISSMEDLNGLKQNIMVDLEAVMPATMGEWSSTNSPLNKLTVGKDEIVLKFDKLAYQNSPLNKAYSTFAGKRVSIKNAVSSTFNNLKTSQLLLTEQTIIEVIMDDKTSALAFGTSFLNKTAAACADGTKDNSEALKAAWTRLKTEFSALSDGAKKVVKDVAANNAGTDLEKAMARYDHIVKRYSDAHTEINDFIGRGVTTSLTNQLFKANTTNNIMVISLIACASAAAIGSFFFIRKRKEQN